MADSEFRMTGSETRDLLQKTLIGEATDADWNDFVYRYRVRMLPWCRKVCLRDEDIDDFLQELWFKVWKSLPNFDRTRSFRRWLAAVRRSTWADFLGRKARSAGGGPIPNWEALADPSSLEELDRQWDDVDRTRLLLGRVRRFHSLEEIELHRRVKIEKVKYQALSTEIGKSIGHLCNTVSAVHQTYQREYQRLQDANWYEEE